MEKALQPLIAQQYTIARMKATGEVLPRIIWPEKP